MLPASKNLESSHLLLMCRASFEEQLGLETMPENPWSQGLIYFPANNPRVPGAFKPRSCIVPLHRELKIGTLHGLLRQGEVTPEEFLRAVEG
jgi:hypothetical protein